MIAKFTGGLRSLIPHRNVKDADEAVDRLDEELSDSTAAPESTTPPAQKKINVVSEDAAADLGTGGREEPLLTPPSKPLVTPLTFDDLEMPDTTVEQKKGAPAPAASKTTEAKVEAQPAATTADVAEVDSDAWDQHEEDVQHIVIADIHVNAAQPRRSFSKAAMAELTSSIEQHGILQPLVVRRTEEGFELIAGERRLRAAKSLGWKRVPCVVRRGVGTGASPLELALIENIQREDLNPVEEALAYRQLNEEYGMTHEEIGRRVGRSRVGITNAIRMLQLPEEVQQGIREGAISSGHAKAILMIPDGEKQVRFYQHLVAEGLTVRKAETRARRIQRTMQLDDPMREKRKGRSAFEIKFSGKLEDHFGFDARVRFLEAKNRFEVVFRTYSQKEIEELLGRLLGERELPKKLDKDVIDARESDDE